MIRVQFKITKLKFQPFFIDMNPIVGCFLLLLSYRASHKTRRRARSEKSPSKKSENKPAWPTRASYYDTLMALLSLIRRLALKLVLIITKCTRKIVV